MESKNNYYKKTPRHNNKMRESAEKMLQINSKDYAIPYQSTGKPVVKIGIAFSQETKTVKEWKVISETAGM